jgi:hypothetical protein
MVAEKGEMMLDELVKETGAAKVLPGMYSRPGYCLRERER